MCFDSVRRGLFMKDRRRRLFRKGLYSIDFEGIGFEGHWYVLCFHCIRRGLFMKGQHSVEFEENTSASC